MATLYRTTRPRRAVAIAAAFCLMLSCVVSTGCTSRVWQAKFLETEKVEDLDVEAPFLKCHMSDGALYVLTRWQVDPLTEVVEGTGLKYNADRQVVRRGKLAVQLDQVALLETNRPDDLQRTDVATLAVLTGVSLVVTAVCLSDPKACFGSCPTFYVNDGQKWVLEAEGFSHSIAKVFESTDVDALERAQPDGRDFVVRMTNEALETHMVRHVDLLAVPRPESGRVYRAGERFYQVDGVEAPTRCQAPAGDCLEAVSAADQREYLSSTDGKDLATKETVEIGFSREDGAGDDETAQAGKLGLVVRARNTLLNTFLFYKALDYMGSSAGEWFARLEQSPPALMQALPQVGDVLGDIVVEVRNADGEWVRAGSFAEVGPIGRDNQLIELPEALSQQRSVQVRLRMTRGNWKLDQVGLVRLQKEVEPVRLSPTRVEHDGSDDAEARARLRDPERYLVTYPRDAYALHYELPEGPQELFLESRGYYYEWMRKKWVEKTEPGKLRELLTRPDTALKRLAPEYKAIEDQVEDQFWNSRIGEGRQ